MIVDFGSTKIKIHELSKYKLNFINFLIKSYDFSNACKKEVSKGYIKDFLNKKYSDANKEWLLELYDDKKKLLGFVILFEFNTFAEIMIICVDSPKFKRMGAALLKYTEVFTKTKLNKNRIMLCSLDTPYGFYKKMGYKVIPQNMCNLLNKEYSEIDINYYENFIKNYSTDMGPDFDDDSISDEQINFLATIDDSACPFNSDDYCIYMYKDL